MHSIHYQKDKHEDVGKDTLGNDFPALFSHFFALHFLDQRLPKTHDNAGNLRNT